MNALVKIVEGDVRTSSRTVAEVFEKEHKDVLRAIDKMIDQRPELRGRNFALTEEVVQAGAAKRRLRVFEMDRDGFTLVAMGFTGPKALDWKVRYIEAFNAMEEALQKAVLPGGGFLTTPDQIERTRVALSMVREARVVYGRAAAKDIWQRLGLPQVAEEEPEPRRSRYRALAYRPPDETMKQWAATDPTKRLSRKGKSTGVTIFPNVSILYADYRSWCAENGCHPAEDYELTSSLLALGVHFHGY